MYERLLLPGSDLGNLLAIPFHLFPKCIGIAALLVILVGGIFALAVERRRCSQVVA
jgi:ABC-type antimicrobial peptide transport system permease subunit